MIEHFGVSNDDIFYKEGQVNEVDWEEINEAYLGLFGYNRNLNPFITKKEVLSGLKTIDLLRKNPKRYPTEGLNLWEYKLSKWLEEYEKDNDKKNDNEQEQQVIISV
jgi:hypothetical protein